MAGSVYIVRLCFSYVSAVYVYCAHRDTGGRISSAPFPSAGTTDGSISLLHILSGTLDLLCQNSQQLAVSARNSKWQCQYIERLRKKNGITISFHSEITVLEFAWNAFDQT